MDDIQRQPDRLYSIGQVARLTGVPIKTIRFYADIDLLPPARTTHARYRQFGADEIWRLEMIRTLRSVGFGLDEIKKLLTGDVSIVQAIEVQLAAVDEQIVQLQRVQQVLTQARNSVQRGEPSLRHLHELGTALAADVQKRREVLIARLRATLNQATITPWQEAFLRSIAEQLPADMSAEQTAAWGELVALVNDPAYAAAIQRQHGLFEHAASDEHDRDQAWQERMQPLMEDAQRALAAGRTSDSAAVQALVDRWLELFASALQRPNSAAFVRWMAEAEETILPREVERFWSLISRIKGHAAPSQFAAQRLIMAGVRRRAAQLNAALEAAPTPPSPAHSDPA